MDSSPERSTRVLFVNNTFDPEQFMEIRVLRGRSINQPRKLKQCYTANHPTSIAQKNDLISLCRSRMIPQEFQNYYDSLIINEKCLRQHSRRVTRKWTMLNEY